MSGRGRAALVLALLVLAPGCALWRGFSGPLSRPTTLPLARDDADPASLRTVVERTLPVYERRGQAARADSLRALLDVLDRTADPEVRRAAVDRLFVVRRVREPVLLTAYYEPELAARSTSDARFRHPIYGRPPDLVDVDLAALDPACAVKTTSGRVCDGRVVPYPTRGEIEAGALAGRGLELAWTDDPVGLFFLQVQGSGRLRFADGRTTGIHFAGTNGRPYTSLGRIMIDRGLLPSHSASASDIRRALEPMSDDERNALMAVNERYVFFRLADEPVRGSLGVALTPGRSIAADPRLVPPGSLAYLDTPSYRRFVVVQDTGAAITGPRADIFLGSGRDAGAVAGRTRERGRLYVLTPR